MDAKVTYNQGKTCYLLSDFSMNINPKVSVCVITYNHGEWLRECLQSIVSQITDYNFEVIVGDDCSTDGLTREVLKDFAVRYPNIIIPLLREANLGGGGTNNWLDVISRARGVYIAHIDGDDRMLPGKLQKQSAFLDKHPECTFVVHDLRTFDSVTGETLGDGFKKGSIPEIVDLEYLLMERCYFGHSSKMFRRDAIITKSRQKATVDFFMHIEHASRGCIGYINEVLGEYRKSTNTASNPNSNGYQLIVQGYEDAYDRALELGSSEQVVLSSRLLFRYSQARSALRRAEFEKFRFQIKLNWSDVWSASWRHRLFFVLSILLMNKKMRSVFVPFFDKS